MLCSVQTVKKRDRELADRTGVMEGVGVGWVVIMGADYCYACQKLGPKYGLLSLRVKSRHDAWRTYWSGVMGPMLRRLSFSGER